MILSFQTDRSEQTLQTQLRRLQIRVYTIAFPSALLDTIMYGKIALYKFKDHYKSIFSCLNFFDFYGILVN